MSVPVLSLPLVVRLPLQAPEAVQEVAFVLDHVKVLALPLTTEVGAAVSVTVGAGVAPLPGSLKKKTFSLVRLTTMRPRFEGT